MARQTIADLPDNERRALRRVVKDGGDTAIASEVYRALKRKGLVYRVRTHERMAWGKVIARLPVVALTPERRAEVESFFVGE